MSSPPATRPAVEPAGDDRLRELAAYGLGNEAVPASQVNPPGLPLTDS